MDHRIRRCGTPRSGGAAMSARLAVLASGGGSNLQAILSACSSGELAASVVCVVSDNANAGALLRAEAAGVPSVFVHPRPANVAMDRRVWDRSLANVVAKCRPDWIVLAGFMRLLTSEFLDQFPHRVVNLHPARPGELPGTKAIERAFAEFTAGTRILSGVMVHLVPNGGVDDGPVLATADVAFRPGDTVADFTDRMHRAERSLLVSTLSRLVQEVSA